MQQLLAKLVFMIQRSLVSIMLLSDIHFFLSVCVCHMGVVLWLNLCNEMNTFYFHRLTIWFCFLLSLPTFENMLQASPTTLFPFTIECPVPSTLFPENISDIKLCNHCHLFEIQITRFSKCRLDLKEEIQMQQGCQKTSLIHWFSTREKCDRKDYVLAKWLDTCSRAKLKLSSHGFQHRALKISQLQKAKGLHFSFILPGWKQISIHCWRSWFKLSYIQKYINYISAFLSCKFRTHERKQMDIFWRWIFFWLKHKKILFPYSI